jgi:hypothetical protein
VGSSPVEGEGGSPAELEQAVSGAAQTTVAGLAGGGGGRLARGARAGCQCRAVLLGVEPMPTNIEVPSSELLEGAGS